MDMEDSRPLVEVVTRKEKVIDARVFITSHNPDI
jgi:hypothetical protein